MNQTTQTTTKPKRKYQSKKDRLRYQLFNAARRCFPPAYRPDEQAVRDKRDYTCAEMFGKPYNELTISELTDVINELDVQSGVASPRQFNLTASQKQIKLLRFYMVSVAFRYFDFSGVEFIDEDTGEHFSGEEVKYELQRKFESKTGWIPKNIFSLLYNEWINPHSHKYLIEGGFKKFTKNPVRLSYEYLKPKEAQYLIDRYKAIYQNIEQYKQPDELYACNTN